MHISLVVYYFFKFNLICIQLLNILEKPINCDCQNNGICVRLQNEKYACSCKYGYAGTQCDKSMN
jgi:hypothetical protein